MYQHWTDYLIDWAPVAALGVNLWILVLVLRVPKMLERVGKKLGVTE